MSPIIRVDDEVYAWLQSKARPFEDTPNSVLRRLADLPLRGIAPTADRMHGLTGEKLQGKPQEKQRQEESVQDVLGERITGDLLARRWSVSVRHALYHKDGTWYQNLRRFPGALFDSKGYVVFRNEDEYRRCSQVSIGEETNVRPHISAIPGYVRVMK